MAGPDFQPASIEAQSRLTSHNSHCTPTLVSPPFRSFRQTR
jgi:hypothetical protein